jgi:ABC-type polar amino acid transport system ATPase subunit
MLVINNLCKSFEKRRILNNINVSVSAGEIAVLLGSSGVGKSTLLRVLNNLETADSGSITLDGNALDLKTVNTSHTVGMVFQHFNLFDHLTVLENITLPLEKTTQTPSAQARSTGLQLLERYGLAEKAECYPAQLSGGQKQRLAIARAIAFNVKIICLDEPTSALDPLLTTYVARSIEKLAADGYIVLIATHDTSLLEKLSCSIYLMQEGSIVESAPSQALAEHPARYPRISAFIAGTID